MVEAEITLYLQQLLLQAVAVDKVMLLPQVEQPHLAVRAVAERQTMGLVEQVRLIKDMLAVVALVAQPITPVAAAAVLAEWVKLQQIQLRQVVLVA
jgi:hypothetical protein